MSSLPPAVDPVIAPAASARPPAALLCRARPGLTLTFDLRADQSVLGRDSSLPVAVPLEGVSRQHARISWDGHDFWLEDLKSTNGTLLNGHGLVRERLRHLDVITLGRTADLIFILRAAERGLVSQQGIVRAALAPEPSDALPHEIEVGEATLGRSSACNIVAEGGAVSKVHARIERTVDQLILEDLGSSNGTFVNGERVMTAMLRDGDVILLAGVESFRVRIEMGQVSFASGVRRQVALPEAGEPRFSPEWKTRFEWSSGEREAIANLHRDLTAQPVQKKSATPAKPASGPAKSSVTAPTPKVRPTPPKSPVPPAPAPPPAAAPPPPPAAPLTEVRLVGGGHELAVTAPGTYALGRATDAPLRVKHPTVSRTHARIALAEDRRAAILEHAGGANGTRLNGRQIEKPEPLSDGDEIGIGEVTLKVSLKRS
jgi:pSer/pThr/pTyr-binding forkhead associated (FHA) protein